MFAALQAWLLAAALVGPAQEIKPAERADSLPAPRPLAPNGGPGMNAFIVPGHAPVAPFGMGNPMYYRPSQMEKWQNYGVDLKGFFRPRVIYSPYGAYYRYNGQPYYLTPVYNLYFMPYVTD